MMKRMFISIFTTVLFTGVAHAHKPKTSYSGFDQAAIIDMKPNYNSCKNAICSALGAQWQEAEPDQFLLKVQVWNSITNIDEATLNIDGEKVRLIRSDEPTRFSPAGSYETPNSQQNFILPLTVLGRITSADRVWIQVLTYDGTIEDAVIDSGKKSKAHKGLVRFKSAVEDAFKPEY